MESFNANEFTIMTGRTGSKEDLYSTYKTEYESKLSEVEKIRVFSANVSEFLIKITDKSKYTIEQIYNNLHNCLYNRRASVFSCGANIVEHQDRFKELKEINDMTICCYKSAVKFFDYDCDILGVGNYINGDYLDKVNCFKFLVMSICFKNIYKNNNFNFSQINIISNTNQIKNFITYKSSFLFDGHNYLMENFYECNVYNFIIFLNFLGIKNIYLFGFFITDNLINISKYTYNDLIISRGHYYDKTNNRILESGAFLELKNSSELMKWANHNNVNIYNVSKLGCISKSIPRITFDSITSNKIEFIEPLNDYIDFNVQFNNLIDYEYYKEHYNTKDPLLDYIDNGIYFYKKLNAKHNMQEINLSEFAENIFYYSTIAYMYPSKNTSKLKPYICHYVLRFKDASGLSMYDNINITKEMIDNLMIEKNFSMDTFKNFTNHIHAYNKYLAKYSNFFKNVEDNIYLSFVIYMVMLQVGIDFDAESYKILNPHLKDLDTLRLYGNYVNHGFLEGRVYKFTKIPSDFNLTLYKKFNKDLSHFNDIEAKLHYEKYGYREGRKYNFVNLPDDFDPLAYKCLNKNLQKLNDEDAKFHYEQYGYKEGRKYKFVNIPNDFNYKTYTLIYKDLNNFSKYQAYAHYENHGYYEKRKYK